MLRCIVVVSPTPHGLKFQQIAKTIQETEKIASAFCTSPNSAASFKRFKAAVRSLRMLSPCPGWMNWRCTERLSLGQNQKLAWKHRGCLLQKSQATWTLTIICIIPFRQRSLAKRIIYSRTNGFRQLRVNNHPKYVAYICKTDMS